MVSTCQTYPVKSKGSADTANETRGRRRKLDETSWKKNVRKRLRNSGESYVSANTGKVMPAKVCELNFDCHCKQTCSKKLSANQKKKIFDSFWKLSDYSRQNIYLRGLIKAKKPVRSRPRVLESGRQKKM